jgi:hypothetical protein
MKSSSSRPNLYRTALLALGCTLGLGLLASTAVSAAESSAAKAAALPVTATFEKVATTEAGPPYVLKLKNESKAALKVSGKVLLSVAFHSSSKARSVPEHVIEPGQVMTVSELAANDKVILTSEGYAPLELTVP